MAVQRFKLALNNAHFPLLSVNAQRAICIPQLDGPGRAPRTFMGNDENIDYNIPTVLYCENVLPTKQGIKSVGYQQVVGPTITNDFDSIFSLRDEDENTVLYSPSNGKNYIYDDVAQAWTTESNIDIWGPAIFSAQSDFAAAKVTYAYVDGKTFVCYSRMKSSGGTLDMSIMQWDAASKTLIPATSIITNLPFAPGEIDGIGSSAGYLLVWSGLTIAWAPFNGAAFDFQIYLNGSFTGAGFQVPEDVQGPITALIGMSGGFVAFTTRNAISASYHAQSISSPWVFREIPDCGGMESYEQATVEGSLGRLVAYTSAGMQSISLNSSELEYSFVSDFISNRAIERYDFNTGLLESGGTTIDLFTKLTAVGNRYIVISYGFFPGTFSYALVYDMAIKRMGKLRIVHRDCFYYTQKSLPVGLTYSMLLDVSYDETVPTTYDGTQITPGAVTAAPHALAFLKANGEVVLATWGAESREEDQAVVILGRIQLSRSAHTELNNVEIDGLKEGRVKIAASYDGRSVSSIEELVTLEATGDYLKAGGLINCKNFNVIVEGTFDISTVILEATPAGRFF